MVLKLSEQGVEAEKQMRAVIFYLTTFGYIDGDFDDREQDFVRNYIRRLVEHRVDGAIDAADLALRNELVGKYTTHFHEVFEAINAQVRDLFTESVATGEDPKAFVHAKLKLRCFEIFKAFDAAGQEVLLDAIDELVRADGQVHPAELEFRAEIAALLEADLGIELIDEPTARGAVAVGSACVLPPGAEDHPFLQSLEFNYSSAPERLRAQVAQDRALLDRVMEILARMRAAGAGRLAGKTNVAELSGSGPFLDGHVHVCPAEPGRQYELTVLGDLHGCYSCLKAALMQSRFFDKVAAFKADPLHHPDPKLVLLGDYIDRGMFQLPGGPSRGAPGLRRGAGARLPAPGQPRVLPRARGSSVRGRAPRGGHQPPCARTCPSRCSSTTCGSSTRCRTCCCSSGSSSCTGGSRATRW
jgi:hypothetical protein